MDNYMTYLVPDNKMILGENQYFDLDCYKTQMNNNVLVVGASGAGKTRSIVSPNILQATGSYIIVDPKGSLYGQYKRYLRRKGYCVQKLNFTDPRDSETLTYNFFSYIHNDQDILKIAHMMVHANYTGTGTYKLDPFWDDASELLMAAIISFLYHHMPAEHRTLQNMLSMLQMCQIDDDLGAGINALDTVFDSVKDENQEDFSYRSYMRFRQAAGRTLQSILITLSSKLAVFDTEDLRGFFREDTVDIARIGRRKTALFVIVSDTDRAMDTMANLFFTQAINVLCHAADARYDNRLPVDVRFILDDFATNVRISDFPRMISSIRSRGISAMLMLQAESQLEDAYGKDGRTIIGNCDTYVYLGGNDLETAERVARRANVPLKQILSMPVGTNWIFRRGQKPVQGRNFDLDAFAGIKMLPADRRRSNQNRNPAGRQQDSLRMQGPEADHIWGRENSGGQTAPAGA